jgi:hypothetical protein
VSRIKVGIRDDKLDLAAEALVELTDEETEILDLAPSKGGVFTTPEREACFRPHGSVRKVASQMIRADSESEIPLRR